ncbi:hypothetical protein [Actinocorallia sp. A-T 12471]|uniref:hypothetical protein n=1 Tax=Actinocorallia sp. A-T 12471 TaxID=3089813 RepID=UPI0029CD7A58|nr:hypothetical protein [Actinocorallia sp. A-T 12471]MDX6739675.1 hypothetical protein [Actinocorallia sp. A-T 12471]
MTGPDESAARLAALAALVRESVEEEVREVAAPHDLAERVLARRRRPWSLRGLTIPLAAVATAAAVVALPVGLGFPGDGPAPTQTAAVPGDVEIVVGPDDLPAGMRPQEAPQPEAQGQTGAVDGLVKRQYYQPPEGGDGAMVEVYEGVTARDFAELYDLRSLVFAGCGFSGRWARNAVIAACEREDGLLVVVRISGSRQEKAAQIAANVEVVR